MRGPVLLHIWISCFQLWSQQSSANTQQLNKDHCEKRGGQEPGNEKGGWETGRRIWDSDGGKEKELINRGKGMGKGQRKGGRGMGEGLSYYCNFNGQPIHFNVEFHHSCLDHTPPSVQLSLDIKALGRYHTFIIHPWSPFQ